MNVDLFVYDKFDKSALDILNLLEKSSLKFTVQVFEENESIDYISNQVGETIRRLPIVVIDGKRIGRYYDLVEFLMNEGVINYQGKSSWQI
jgi:glutaredoxin|tara:strand:- start:476 stop:748 length:273 start_codon:yes stop_codon:yes gene_type:complete